MLQLGFEIFDFTVLIPVRPFNNDITSFHCAHIDKSVQFKSVMQHEANETWNGIQAFTKEALPVCTRQVYITVECKTIHDDVIRWKHFSRYWPFVRGIHRSTVNSPYKGQWRGALMISLICAWINGWVNNRQTGEWRRHPLIMTSR